MSEDDAKHKAQVDAKAMGGPRPGEIYRHYKGGLYVVVARSIKEDTLEPLVTYQSNERGTIWTRTLADFTALVSCSAVKTGGPGPRFLREKDQP